MPTFVFQRFAFGIGLGCAATAFGCSQKAYRERTDADVEAIITQKNIAEEWKVENWHVYPDSRARYADPSCPDFPPYPPDDYDVTRGGFMGVGLLFMAATPRLAARLRGRKRD